MVKTAQIFTSVEHNIPSARDSMHSHKLRKAKEHNIGDIKQKAATLGGKENIPRGRLLKSQKRLVRASTPPERPLLSPFSQQRPAGQTYYLDKVREGFRNISRLSTENCRNLNHFQFVRQCYEVMRFLPRLQQKNEVCKLQADKKLLVLDLDETLVHTFLQDAPEGCQQVNVNILDKADKTMFFKVRPGCMEFLHKAAQVFDIYVFTAASANYANAVIDRLDPDNKIFKGRYYSDSCTRVNQYTIKDLSIFNRDLKDVILVDNTALCFGLQKENGVPIVCFTGQDDDKELGHLWEFLAHLNGLEDVRDGIMQHFKWDKFSKLYRDTDALCDYYF